MAFEMIKINYSLWQEFYPESRRLGLLSSPPQLAKCLPSSAPFYPTSLSLLLSHFPQVVCLMFPGDPSLLVQHPMCSLTP